MKGIQLWSLNPWLISDIIFYHINPRNFIKRLLQLTLFFLLYNLIFSLVKVKDSLSQFFQRGKDKIVITAKRIKQILKHAKNFIEIYSKQTLKSKKTTISYLNDYSKKLNSLEIINRVKSNLISLLHEEEIFTKNSPTITNILKRGDPTAVVKYLTTQYKFFAYPSITFLVLLYEYASYIEKREFKFRNANKLGNKVIIHFCCWGPSYAAKVKNYLLPSLLARNNLPALAEEYNISLLIHCDMATKDTIMQSDVYKKLEDYADISFYVFPKTLMSLYNFKSGRTSSIFPQIRYLLLGVCQAHAFKIALKHGAYLSYMMPDVVLSESFLQYAFSKIKHKKMVLTTTFRTNFQSVFPHLEKFYNKNTIKDQLCIPENELIELQINHIHPCEKKRIVSKKTKNFSSSARLLFKNKNGFIFRCFHYHPAIINCANIQKPITLDYLPIDNTALNDVLEPNLPYDDQVWVCTDPSKMAIMELSDEAPEFEVIINTTTLSYKQLVSQVQDLLIQSPDSFNTSFNQYLASFRHALTIPEYENSLASDDDIIDDNKFFKDIHRSIENTVHA